MRVNNFFIIILTFFVVFNNGYAADRDEKKAVAMGLADSAPMQIAGLQPQPQLVTPDKAAAIRVLVIDGGGIRGAYAAAILQKLETDSKKRICDLFQGGITGTSTGAFIALALSAPKHKKDDEEDKSVVPDADGFVPGPYSARQIVKFYNSMGETIFGCCTPSRCWENASTCPTSCCGKIGHTLWDIFCCFGCFACCKNCAGYCGPRYSNEALQRALNDRFGDIELGKAIVPVQVVAYNIELNRPAYFKSTTHTTFKMRDVALASSAAPTYFPPVIIKDHDGVERKCVDGGIFDNSAGIAALRFASEMYGLEIPPPLSDFVLVSVGTGSKVRASRFDRLRNSGNIGWAADAADISMTGTSQATDENLEGILPDTRYFRIQTQLEGSEASLDDARQIGRLVAEATEAPPAKYKEFVKVHIKKAIPAALGRLAALALVPSLARAAPPASHLPGVPARSAGADEAEAVHAVDAQRVAEFRQEHGV